MRMRCNSYLYLECAVAIGQLIVNISDDMKASSMSYLRKKKRTNMLPNCPLWKRTATKKAHHSATNSRILCTVHIHNWSRIQDRDSQIKSFFNCCCCPVRLEIISEKVVENKQSFDYIYTYFWFTLIVNTNSRHRLLFFLLFFFSLSIALLFILSTKTNV